MSKRRQTSKKKSFDVNPKRGAIYFCLGFLVFPLMIGWEVIQGAEVSVLRAALFTLGASIFIGVLGIFTENVGV